MNDLRTRPSQEEYRRLIQTFRIAGALAALVIFIGAVFYHYAEDWSWLDSLYFSVTTLATVGFGDLAPTTAASKLFTIVYILSGIGLIAAFANIAVRRAVMQKPKK